MAQFVSQPSSLIQGGSLYPFIDGLPDSSLKPFGLSVHHFNTFIFKGVSTAVNMTIYSRVISVTCTRLTVLFEPFYQSLFSLTNIRGITSWLFTLDAINHITGIILRWLVFDVDERVTELVSRLESCRYAILLIYLFNTIRQTCYVWNGSLYSLSACRCCLISIVTFFDGPGVKQSYYNI